MIDSQSCPIKRYQKQIIILIMAYITSSVIQINDLQMFFDGSLGKVMPRKNELYFMGNLTLSIGEK